MQLFFTPVATAYLCTFLVTKFNLFTGKDFTLGCYYMNHSSAF